VSWEEAVRKLFQKHPRAMSANTVIEAIKENHCDAQLRAEGRIAERERIIKVLEEHPPQTETQPNAHTAPLPVRARYRAEGRVYEREAIAQQLKNLPADALFYPENILKILKLY